MPETGLNNPQRMELVRAMQAADAIAHRTAARVLDLQGRRQSRLIAAVFLATAFLALATMFAGAFGFASSIALCSFLLFDAYRLHQLIEQGKSLMLEAHQKHTALADLVRRMDGRSEAECQAAYQSYLRLA